MSITLPTHDAQPVTETEPETPSMERTELFEDYWLLIGLTHAEGSRLGASEATKNDTDRSPLARAYEHFKAQKTELAKKVRDHEYTFAEYAEHFKQPKGDVTHLTNDDFRDFGVAADKLPRHPVFVPSEYELAPVWDESIQNETGDDSESFRALLESVDGVGPKTAAAIIEAAAEAGFGLDD